MTFGSGNLAADALREDDEEIALPYLQTEILDALADEGRADAIP